MHHKNSLIFHHTIYNIDNGCQIGFVMVSFSNTPSITKVKFNSNFKDT